uniref:protein-tyrosine-phosphatase n=1 Tax=Serinus canaria TaxID=9135 RepID=A0A8C9MFH5_SERCA
MVKPLRDRDLDPDRDRDPGPDVVEGPGPTMSPPLSSQPAAAPADGFASSDDEAAEEDPSPLHISWLSLSPLYSSEFLGLCSLPGCKFKDIRRNLQKDVGELKSCGIQDVFVLCTRGELSKYRVPNLIDTYQQHGMCVHHHPIPDGNAPDIATCCKILEELRTCLENKQKTMIHCYGGLGRSCLGKHLSPCLTNPTHKPTEPNSAGSFSVDAIQTATTRSSLVNRKDMNQFLCV